MSIIKNIGASSLAGLNWAFDRIARCVSIAAGMFLAAKFMPRPEPSADILLIDATLTDLAGAMFLPVATVLFLAAVLFSPSK